MKVYDILIIGGGIAGCSLAYFFKNGGFSVAIIDKNGIATGGSGSAGAFLSPMIGKDNQFKRFLNHSLKFSLNFYEQHFSKLLIKKGVLRVPKNENDREKFKEYAKFNQFETFEVPKNSFLKDEIRQFGGFYFAEAGIIKPINLCLELSNGCDIYIANVEKIDKTGDVFDICGVKAKKVILAQGSVENLVFEDYIKIKAIWGQRITIKTDLQVDFNIHQNISISVSNGDLISIGATCERDISKAKVSREVSLKLIDEAKSMINLDDYEIVSEVGGFRASSKDYFPIIGKVINSCETLKKYPYIRHGFKPKIDDCIFYDDIFIINGLGARGFVMAPYLANMLFDFIVRHKQIDKNLDIYRMFIREARRN